MKTVIVAENIDVAKKLAGRLDEWFDGRVSFCEVPLQGDLIGNIKAAEPELLLTIDLVGFDRVTLTDNIAYNLLDCKQVHVLCSEDMPNEKALEKSLSIAMFFACSQKEQSEMLKGRYLHIPWIGCMDGWNSTEDICVDRNIEEIAKVLETVIKECRLV